MATACECWGLHFQVNALLCNGFSVACSCTVHLQYVPFWALLGLALMLAGCAVFSTAVSPKLPGSGPYLHQPMVMLLAPTLLASKARR